MPSIKQELGKYVIVRPRKNGTCEVVFKVPERLRPSGWLAVRPLPRTGTRTGDLTNADEVKRIIQDAKELNDELSNFRLGRLPMEKPYTIPCLIREWQKSDRWQLPRDDGGYAPRTKNFYQKVLNAHITPWSTANNHPDVRTMSRPAVTQFLDKFSAQPYVQRQIRSTLAAMLSYAMDYLGWITSNPATERKLRMPKRSKVMEWCAADVEIYAATARELGWLGGERLVVGLWETTARISDAIMWRRNVHYIPDTGFFAYDTEKTGEEVPGLPVSRRFRDLLDEPKTMFLILDRDGSAYEPVVDDRRLTNDFKWLRRAVLAKGGPYRILRQLRHSAVNDALDKGATREDVQGATAHTTDQTVRIYERQSSKRGERLQRKRGLIP